jgi:nucleoside-triphosphatase
MACISSGAAELTPPALEAEPPRDVDRHLAAIDLILWMAAPVSAPGDDPGRPGVLNLLQRPVGRPYVHLSRTCRGTHRPTEAGVCEHPPKCAPRGPAMPSLSPKNTLLTGPPGCGKTTVLAETVAILRASGWQVCGFWTPEIREGGARLGFAVELVGGDREVLASRDRPGPPRVGRYGVHVEAMDRLVVPEIERGVAAASSRSDVVIVMDEIGKMELFSQAFQEAVLSAFDSPARVLATIMARPHPFADRLKVRGDVRLISVTRQNRESLAGSTVGKLLEH